MISIDFNKHGIFDSARFAFVENGWVYVAGVDVERYLQLRKHMNINTVGNYVQQLLDTIFTKFPFLNIDNQLMPRAVEVSKSPLYFNYISIHVDKDETCPITYENARDVFHPVLLNGHIYEKKDIIDWINLKGTCPLTRKKVSLVDLKDFIF
jgi:hypothetical protein